jgi:hypothetical protein
VHTGTIEQLGVELDNRGNVKSDEFYMSSLPGVPSVGERGAFGRDRSPDHPRADTANARRQHLDAIMRESPHGFVASWPTRWA